MAERLRVDVIFNSDEAERKARRFNRELGNTDQAAAQSSTRMQKLGSAIGAISGAVAAATPALFTFKKAFDFAQEGAQTLRLQQAGQNLARNFGQDMDAIVHAIQEASNETITEMDAMGAANRALLLGVAQTPEEFGRLSRAAIALGQAMGLDANRSIQDITTGIGRMSPLILDNLGITTEGGRVYERYADSIGKAADDLTDAEKKQALFNATVEAAAPLLDESGNVAEDAATAYERLNVTVQEGQRAFKEWLAQGLLPWLTTIPQASRELAILRGNLPPYVQAQMEAQEATEDAAEANRFAAEMARGYAARLHGIPDEVRTDVEVTGLEEAQEEIELFADTIRRIERRVQVAVEVAARSRVAAEQAQVGTTTGEQEFQHGGSFIVPGSGTRDRPFRMNMAPGEMVNVIPREIVQNLNFSPTFNNSGMGANELLNTFVKQARRL